eukprot:gene22669-28879_t
MPADITLAAVTGAHGVAGEVRLKLFGDGAATLKRHLNHAGAINAGAITLTTLRDDGKGGAIARFAECADRTAAEGLRGTALAVGKYLGRRFYVELVTDGHGYNATSIEFRLTRWLSLLGTVSTLYDESA